VTAGALVPIGAALIHGLTVGFGKYWSDVVAFRAGHELHSDFESRGLAFQGSLPKAEADLLAVAIVGLVGLLFVLRRRTERALLVAWLLAALVAFNLGGLFWTHYYVQLVPVFAVLAGIGATAFRFRLLAVVLTCVAIAPVVETLIHVATTRGEAHDAAIPYAGSFEVDKQVAAYARRNTTPRDTIYVLDSRATIYYLADRRTTYPYLWHHSPLLTASGMDLLRGMLAARDRPKIVIAYRSEDNLDPTKRLGRILARNYRVVWRPVKGIRMMVRRDAAVPAPPLSAQL
jgi:hypothetical protein